MRGCQVLLLLLLSFPLWSGEYRVIAYAPANAPYNLPNGKGIFYDIFVAVSKITGDVFVHVPLPVARGLNEFDKGKVDIEPGVSPVWRTHVRNNALYSLSYGASYEVVVFRPGERKSVLHPSDLFDDEVGAVRGFSYPRFDTAFSAGMVIRVQGGSEYTLAEQLLKGRFNQIFIGKTTFLHLQREHPAFRSLEMGDVVAQAEVMMRIHISKAELLPRLNQALLALKKKGEIAAIYAKYR